MANSWPVTRLRGDLQTGQATTHTPLSNTISVVDGVTAGFPEGISRRPSLQGTRRRQSSASLPGYWPNDDAKSSGDLYIKPCY